jgi:hypothetical protein
MSNTMKNTLVVLGVVALAYFGYYLQMQNSMNTLSFKGGADTESAYQRTQSFLQYQAELSKVTLDDIVLTDVHFLERKKFSPELENEELGRENPFLPVL